MQGLLGASSVLYSALSGLSAHKPVIQRLVAWLVFWDREEGNTKISIKYHVKILPVLFGIMLVPCVSLSQINLAFSSKIYTKQANTESLPSMVAFHVFAGDTNRNVRGTGIH